MHELYWCEILLFPVISALTIEIINEYHQFKKMVAIDSWIHIFVSNPFTMKSEKGK